MLIGKDRLKRGKVLRVFPKNGRVVVEGLNLVKRHQRSRRQGQKGQIVSVPRAVDISNLMLVCKSCGKAARTGFKILEGGKKVRVCKKCGGET